MGMARIRVKDVDPAVDVSRRPDLDYETKDAYNIKVTATGQSNVKAFAEVTIRLINLNESPVLQCRLDGSDVDATD